MKASEHLNSVITEMKTTMNEGDSSKTNEMLVPNEPQALVNKSGLLGPEVDQYLLESVLNLVDKPLAFGELLGLDDVLMEWALMEDLELSKKSGKST